MTDQHRHLAAIMFSDIVGYTAMMEANEEEGKEKAKHYRKILQKNIDQHAGTLIQNYGDGSLTTFTSVVDAVHCARAIQEELKSTTPYVPLRIGIHLGDIVVEDDEIYGNGVNVASRIESMGVEGAVLLSKPVFDQLRNHQEFQLTSLGKFEFKNVEEPLEIFALSNEGFPVPSKKILKGKFKEKKKSRKKILYSLLLLILLVSGSMWIWQQVHAGKSNLIRSLAVLPIDNFSGDENQEYLVSGIRDNLITALSRIGSLRITSKTSTAQYKNTDKTIQQIATELGVDAIIEASVTRFDDSIQLNVQLIRAFPKEDHIWTNVFDKPVANIPSMFNEITEAITKEISLRLSSKEKGLLSVNKRIDPRAYEYYLKGRFHWYLFSPGDLNLAVNYFENAIKIDPDYALAYVGLSDAIGTQAHVGYIPPGDNFDKAKDLLLKAISLDPDLAEAHDLLARMRFAIDWDWEDAEREFNKAIDLNPNFPDVRIVYAQYLITRGRTDEAGKQLLKAKELDPFNPWPQGQYAELLFYSGHYNEAVNECRQLFQTFPDNIGGLSAYSEVLFMTGQTDECLKIMSKFYRFTGDSVLSDLIDSRIGANSFSKIMKLVSDELSGRAEKFYVKPIILARDYMMAGEKKEALFWFKKACDEKDSFLVYYINSPIFEKIHNDPVFKEVLGIMNLSEKDIITR